MYKFNYKVIINKSLAAAVVGHILFSSQTAKICATNSTIKLHQHNLYPLPFTLSICSCRLSPSSSLFLLLAFLLTFYYFINFIFYLSFCWHIFHSTYVHYFYIFTIWHVFIILLVLFSVSCFYLHLNGVFMALLNLHTPFFPTFLFLLTFITLSFFSITFCFYTPFARLYFVLEFYLRILLYLQISTPPLFITRKLFKYLWLLGI